ncbi:MAG: DUF4270 domain-containing protein [Vicingaceae bacterium]
MNNTFYFLSLRKVIILSASFLLLLSACKKEGELNPEFAENTSFTFFTDSIKINTSTRESDSVLADRIATGLLGTYQDSSFGKTKSSIYVQPLLPSNTLILGEDDEELFVDSVIFSLSYNSWFGDTSVAQNIEVFRLDEELDADNSYYSSGSVNTLPTPLATKSFIPHPRTESVILLPNASGGIDTSAVSPQLRIRLDDALGTEILSKSGEAELSNNASFITFFKGLKISPNEQMMLNDNEKAILYFALTSSQTKMTVFYSAVNINSGDTVKKLVDFPINSSSVRFNTFEHDFSNGAVQMNLSDGGKDSIYSYTQAMAGVETVITFPDLKQRFQDERIVVNKAELVLPVASGSYANFGLAQTMTLASRDASGLLQFIPDNDPRLETPAYFGGSYIESENEYRFNIARYIQGYINGVENENGLTLLVTGSAVKAERAVILAQGNQGRKIKLNLYYSNTQ